MIRFIFIQICICFLLVSCNHKEKIETFNINGIWIPKDIHIESPSTGDPEIDALKFSDFYTLYFYNNSNIIIVSSVQSIGPEDSVNIFAEEGYIINKGVYNRINNSNNILIKTKIVYKTFKPVGETFNYPMVNDTLSYYPKNEIKTIKYKGTIYVKGDMYYKKSKTRIQSLPEVDFEKLYKSENGK